MPPLLYKCERITWLQVPDYKDTKEIQKKKFELVCNNKK